MRVYLVALPFAVLGETEKSYTYQKLRGSYFFFSLPKIETDASFSASHKV